jgi:hypothetical protein
MVASLMRCSEENKTICCSPYLIVCLIKLRLYKGLMWSKVQYFAKHKITYLFYDNAPQTMADKYQRSIRKALSDD